MDDMNLIQELCEIEWRMFDAVNNTSGRASCQEDAVFFKKMRACQFDAWGETLLSSYLNDLHTAEAEGRNVCTEKYAYMMERTHPAEFAPIKHMLPAISDAKATLIEGIVTLQLEWERSVDEQFPHMRAGGRPLTSDKDTECTTSFQTYLEGELKTYSEMTLSIYIAYMLALQGQGKNLALMTAENTARAYGFASLEEANEQAKAQPGLFAW